MDVTKAADAFRSALGPRSDLSRAEPDVAANIAVQMSHMGMQPLSLSLIRRLRDVVATVRPNKVLECGAGIGHLSAWLLDHWTMHDDEVPEAYEIMEQGSRFAVILNRVLERYEATEWSRIHVGSLTEQRAETQAWRLANLRATVPPPTVMDGLDLAIVHPSPTMIDDVQAAVSLLREGGILLTVEPQVPDDATDPESEEGAASIALFNAWMEFVRSAAEHHDPAFMPVTGGTLVAVRTSPAQA